MRTIIVLIFISLSLNTADCWAQSKSVAAAVSFLNTEDVKSYSINDLMLSNFLNRRFELGINVKPADIKSKLLGSENEYRLIRPLIYRSAGQDAIDEVYDLTILELSSPANNWTRALYSGYDIDGFTNSVITIASEKNGGYAKALFALDLAVETGNITSEKATSIAEDIHQKNTPSEMTYEETARILYSSFANEISTNSAISKVDVIETQQNPNGSWSGQSVTSSTLYALWALLEKDSKQSNKQDNQQKWILN